MDFLLRKFNLITAILLCFTFIRVDGLVYYCGLTKCASHHAARYFYRFFCCGEFGQECCYEMNVLSISLLTVTAVLGLVLLLCLCYYFCEGEEKDNEEEVTLHYYPSPAQIILQCQECCKEPHLCQHRHCRTHLPRIYYDQGPSLSCNTVPYSPQYMPHPQSYPIMNQSQPGPSYGTYDPRPQYGSHQPYPTQQWSTNSTAGDGHLTERRERYSSMPSAPPNFDGNNPQRK